MWKRYYTPRTLRESLALLAEYKENARVVAGGTDLLVELDRKVKAPEALIDITRIPGLDQITIDDDGNLHLGPLVTHNHVANSALCVNKAFALARACWEVGAPQIRNRGTVAGNLVTASPANDTITPLWAMDAILTLQSKRGSRQLTMSEFFKGVRKTALEADELLVDVCIPRARPGVRSTFVKLGLRRAQAISLVNVAVAIRLYHEKVAEARITLGSVAPTIVRATHAENYLSGKRLTEQIIAVAGELATTDARPIDDIRGPAEYRRSMVNVATVRALTQIHTGSESDGFPKFPVNLWGQTDGHFPTWKRKPANYVPCHVEDGEQLILTTVNGKRCSVQGANDKTLLRMLREDLALTGAKEGCSEGECGACTVLLDGIAVMACLVPAPRAHGARIVTVEGLATRKRLHPLQQAFIDAGAVQCGYCTPGFLMAAASLIEEKPAPTPWDIQQAISGNLCRCTGYAAIISAIEQAASLVK
jgi:xanthine dehydrogenase iron-sulfur cluster and FAD-binding subunit A